MYKKILPAILFILICTVGIVWWWGAAPGKISAETYLSKSLTYHQQGNYQKCISAAEQAIKLRPNYAEAYNNIGSMQQWDKGIIALEKALAIKPDFQLAKNNLAWAKKQKTALR